MALQPEKEDALLVWINSFKLGDPIHHILLLQDVTLLVKLIHKLTESEKDVQPILDLPVQGRLEFVSNFLQKDCQYKGDRGTIISWDNILRGTDLDLELSKVIVLLLYHSVMNCPAGYNKLDYKIETELASVLRFVLCNDDHLYLSDNLEKYLRGQRIYDMSSLSSTSSFSDEESPVFSMRRKPAVHFLELKTVASSSVGSPIQDILNTPQFQLRKLQKQLRQERDIRDELERELGNSHQIITERETQIIQLQHRVQQLMRDNAEHDQQPKEMEELLSKNERLIQRLHEVLKQCQDLKTNNNQMEKKIDDLTEENGILSVQIREVASLLSSAQAAVVKLNEELQSSQAEWESKRALLENELNQALSQKDYLSEQIQILHGKISILEDELSKANAETQEGGEVMGHIMELDSLHKEMKEKEDLEVKSKELEEIRRKELENRIDQLQAQVVESSAFAAEQELELDSLRKEIKEKDNLSVKALEMKEGQCKELEERIAQLQTQLTESSAFGSERQSELECLRNEVKEKDHVADAQRIELEGTINQLKEQLHVANSLASVRDQVIEKLNEDLRRIDVTHQMFVERDGDRLRALAAEEQNRKELEETVAKLKQEIVRMSTEREQTDEKRLQEIKLLKDENAVLLKCKDTLLKEQEVCKQVEASLERKLEMAKEDLATFLPLRDSMAEKDRLYSELKEQLEIKSEALDHYKAQIEKAKTHYNAKKQQVLEAQEKVQTLEKALESSEQEIKTLKGQTKLLESTLDQTKLSEKNLTLKVNSLQAQIDYADRQLREHAKLQGRAETLKARETVSHPLSEKQEADEKQEDLSKDSLDFGLDDSLNATRRPFAREESSTPLVRSSERLAAKRRALGGESVETLYFTPLNNRDHTQRKPECSITSLGELVLDSGKKGHSAHRRTTQVINITMTKKTPVRANFDSENESFYSLQSAQSYPNLASQKGRFISMEMFEEPVTGNQLRNLPGYRRSTAHGSTTHRNSNAFGVGAENEPELNEDWIRIAELQARNKACLPHLKSSYSLETRASIGIPSFAFTDEDVKTGDPNETIRRASMLPGQIHKGLPSHRASMLPAQISAGVASHRATLAPKLPANGVPKTGGSTLSLKRSANDLQDMDTPETKKMSSCFPRPMTPKDRNDRRFASHNNQNRPPNTPVERRQSMMFSIENTPKKNIKSNILQRGINKMRGSTRKSPSSASRMTRSGKSPKMDSAKPQRRSPRIATGKSPKITASAKKIMIKSRMKV